VDGFFAAADGQGETAVGVELDTETRRPAIAVEAREHTLEERRATGDDVRRSWHSVAEIVYGVGVEASKNKGEGFRRGHTEDAKEWKRGFATETQRRGITKKGGRKEDGEEKRAEKQNRDAADRMSRLGAPFEAQGAAVLRFYRDTGFSFCGGLGAELLTSLLFRRR
jgi:hypothetical protein